MARVFHLAWIVLFLVSIRVIVPSTTSAPASCPVDRPHLVPRFGGRWFLIGANVPWLNEGFGADFGTVEEWNQHTYLDC